MLFKACLLPTINIPCCTDHSVCVFLSLPHLEFKHSVGNRNESLHFQFKNLVGRQQYHCPMPIKSHEKRTMFESPSKLTWDKLCPYQLMWTEAGNRCIVPLSTFRTPSFACALKLHMRVSSILIILVAFANALLYVP